MIWYHFDNNRTGCHHAFAVEKSGCLWGTGWEVGTESPVQLIGKWVERGISIGGGWGWGMEVGAYCWLTKDPWWRISRTTSPLSNSKHWINFPGIVRDTTVVSLFVHCSMPVADYCQQCQSSPQWDFIMIAVSLSNLDPHYGGYHSTHLQHIAIYIVSSHPFDRLPILTSICTGNAARFHDDILTQ